MDQETGMPRQWMLTALLLAACVADRLESGPADPGPVPPAGSCGASDLQRLVGQPASLLQTMRFAQPVRILRPGMAVTMDYSEDRLNIEIDGAEVIVRVGCG
jgi:hypothetical protein